MMIAASYILQIFGVAGSMMLCTVDFIFMLRVWVLFSCSRTFPSYICASYDSRSHSFNLYGCRDRNTDFAVYPCWVGFFRMPPSVLDLPRPAVPGCLSLIAKPEIWALHLIPLLIITCAMFLMSIFKCGRTLFEFRRSGGRDAPYEPVFPGWHILVPCCFQSVGFPHMMICWVARPTLNEVMFGPCLAAYSIIAAHTLLNIKTILTRQSGDALASTVLLELVGHCCAWQGRARFIVTSHKLCLEVYVAMTLRTL